MQVALSEKILRHLSGSNSVNPVIESQLLKLGRKSDVIQELKTLDLSRKIVRCRITKNGASNEVIYLAGQIVGPGELRLHNLSGSKKTITERRRYCKNCDQDLPRQLFAVNARKCMDCMKKLPIKVCKPVVAAKQIGTRLCVICKERHPQDAFIGYSRMCLATKDQHARHKKNGQKIRQGRLLAKYKAEKEGVITLTTGRPSNRKGIVLSAEVRAKISEGQRIRHQQRA